MSPQATEPGNACGIGSLSKLSCLYPLYLRIGLSIRLVRTLLELNALGVGWLLDDPAGIGTPAFAWLTRPRATFVFSLYHHDLVDTCDRDKSSGCVIFGLVRQQRAPRRNQHSSGCDMLFFKFYVHDADTKRTVRAAGNCIYHTIRQELQYGQRHSEVV